MRLTPAGGTDSQPASGSRVARSRAGAYARRLVPDPPVLPFTALVTGASAGIGEATARSLAGRPGIRLVLVARREDRLRQLVASLPAPATWIAVDLTAPDAPARVRAHVEEHHDRLGLLVNNAGAAWRAPFAEGGWPNVRRTMELNFDAVVRLTEALLPLLRAGAPSALVNVASTAGRVARSGTGAYSASKFALLGWTDALAAEEAPAVHVAAVLPGFVRTEGFPARELTGRAATRWLVSTPEVAAAAILDAGLNRRSERYVPRAWALVAAARVLLPGLVRRIVASPAAAVMTTRTGADDAEAGAPTRGG